MNDIKVIYWEGNDNKDVPFTSLYYAEWKRDGRSEWAYADDARFNYGEDTDADAIESPMGSWQVRTIPDDVRETIAIIVAPSLADKLGKLEDDRANWQSRALIAESAQQRAHIAMTALTNMQGQLLELMTDARNGDFGPAIAAVARAHSAESAAP